MSKYIAITPIKAGKKGAGITPVGGEIELDKDAAKPLLDAGSIATPANAKKLLEAGAPGDMASMQARVDDLTAENDGLREQVAGLEKQVSELTAAADAAKGGAGAGGGKDGG